MSFQVKYRVTDDLDAKRDELRKLIQESINLSSSERPRLLLSNGTIVNDNDDQQQHIHRPSISVETIIGDTLNPFLLAKHELETAAATDCDETQTNTDAIEDEIRSDDHQTKQTTSYQSDEHRERINGNETSNYLHSSSNYSGNGYHETATTSSTLGLIAHRRLQLANKWAKKAAAATGVLQGKVVK